MPTQDCVRKMVVAVFLSALMAATGCSRNPATGQRELILISTEQEIQIGQEASPEFEKEFGGKVPNEQLQAYVREVGGKVAGRSDREMPYEYTLVASDVPNAFALPGGKIFITAGLMSRMSNERQLAAVLGHETGHVAALHNVKGMQKQMGAAVLVEVASTMAGQEKAKAAEAATKVVTTMALLKYSRDDEYQADTLGIRYMARAGYNPWGMVELLTVLQEMSDRNESVFQEMLQTHPITAKRIEQAKGTIEGGAEYQHFSAKATDPGADRFGRMRNLLVKTVGKAP